MVARQEIDVGYTVVELQIALARLHRERLEHRGPVFRPVDVAIAAVLTQVDSIGRRSILIVGVSGLFGKLECAAV